MKSSSSSVQPTVPLVTLSNGVKMPIIGLGTYTREGLSSPDEFENAVRAALDAGYRHIDTATVYDNEEAIGKVLKAYEKEKGVKREEIFITTKVWSNYCRENEVEEGLKESLARLQTNYVDLFLVHMPVAYTRDLTKQDPSVRVEEIWRGMERIYDRGLAKAIGVSNFSIAQLERIMAVARVPIHNHQVELHLHFPQWAMQECCDKHNIALCAYAPMGSPGRVNSQPEWPRPRVDWGNTPEPLQNPLVLRLAEKHGKSPAQILLRHIIQRNIVAIPKSTNPKRIKENFQIFDFELTPAEMNELNSVPAGPRLFKQPFLANHPEDPWAEER